MRSAGATRVLGPHQHEHIHHKANSGDTGQVPIDKGFLRRVDEAVSQAGSILITGPASAKKELAAYVKQDQPGVAARIVGIEAMDHPSDGELLAFARKFFAPVPAAGPAPRRNAAVALLQSSQADLRVRCAVNRRKRETRPGWMRLALQQIRT